MTDLLATVTVTRYVTPLREGGSLPGVVEGDDLADALDLGQPFHGGTPHEVLTGEAGGYELRGNGPDVADAEGV